MKRFKQYIQEAKGSINNEVDNFIASGRRNAWIQHPKNSDEPHIKAYLRNSMCMHDGQLKSCIDMANVEVHPDHQKKGLFKGMMQHIENHVNNGAADMTRVENIMNPDLEANLRKHGYQEHENYGGTPSLIKLKNT